MQIQRRRAVLTFLFASVLALALALSGGARAGAEEPGFDFLHVKTSDTQAGGHPDVEIDVQFRQSDFQCASECLAARTFSVHWPTGFIGNPHVAPKCTLTEFNQGRCPIDSQVGKFVVDFSGIQLYVPLYNMETRPDQAGLLGFTAPLLNFPNFLELSSRTDGDYGLEAETSPMVRLPFNHYKTVLWGVPASPVHDVDRFFTPLTGVGACYIGVFGPDVEGCPPGLEFVSTTFAPPTNPEAPYLQNPTTCGGGLTFTADVAYYDGREAHAETPFPATTGCQQASFSPSLVAKPTTSRADSPSGLDMDLKVPQTQSPVTPSPSEIRNATVELPPGFTLNPNAADGKVACTADLTAIGTLLGARCPEHAKVASLMLDVAALPEPIPGSLYLAEPVPGDPYRVLLTADGFATHVKLFGSVRPDPVTGRLSLVFQDLPQAPLQDFSIHVFGSERGAFATPTQCGSPPVESEFTAWNDQLAIRHATGSMTFDSGPDGSACPNGPRPFDPGLQVGSESNTAGAHSPFSLTTTRGDGEQELDRIEVTTPPGFAATLKGIPYCPEEAIAKVLSAGRSGVAEQAASACPDASRVGTVYGGAGSGSHPLYLPGKVYLAGPYEGAPLSLLAVVPAVSGPYDLGNVGVRVGIRVDPVTAQVTATSDVLPKIVEGIPLRTRSIRIDLDRPGFALNPTNCEPFSVQASIAGSEGATAAPSRHFQVANCAALGFEPKLSVQLLGSTQRNGNPALRAVLTAGSGEANVRSVVATMPHAEFVAVEHLRNVCSRVQFAERKCPAGSVYGEATAYTPLLDKPLEGPVYLRSSRSGLPDIVADLRGQLSIVLAAHIDSVDGRLRAKFDSVPDAPVSRFVLEMKSGSKGLLVNSEDLCTGPKKANVRFTGQNGATLMRAPKLRTSCGKSSKRAPRRKGVR